MAVIKLVQIVSISHPRPGWSVVAFDNGEVREIEWRCYADEGPVFAKLADPAYANQCLPVDHGYALEWPDGMDWSAGAVLQAGRAVTKLVGGPLFQRPRQGRRTRTTTARSHK